MATMKEAIISGQDEVRAVGLNSAWERVDMAKSQTGSSFTVKTLVR